MGNTWKITILLTNFLDKNLMQKGLSNFLYLNFLLRNYRKHFFHGNNNLYPE